MGEQKNIIVINGKSYDASTGSVIGSTPSTPIAVSDFEDRPVKNNITVTHHKSSRSPNHIVHHKVHKSVTLKRNLPKKHSVTAHAKSLPITGAKTKTIKSSQVSSLANIRLERAKKVDKSNSISKFNLVSSITKSHQPIEVKPAPQAPVIHAPAPKINHVSKTSEELFNDALSRADSHNQTYHKVSHRKHRIAKKLGMSARTGNIVTAILIVAVLGSFIAYQNGPNIAMRVAASQSGLSSASLPAYKPSGFSLNRHVNSEPGKVTVNYKSNSDNRAFSITQASSSWNSQTLEDSFLNDKQAERISQSNGKTVYLYDGTNATWVDSGVWYRVEGNSSLTTDQLLKLANSF